jgi:uncharacterized protein (DUF433 family)
MAEVQTIPVETRIAELEARLARLEARLPADTGVPHETPVPPWKHLVLRRHPWRKQLYIKGRNMTVRHVIGGVSANGFSEEEGAKNYGLPVEAIREAFAYAEANPEVLELDAAHERYLLKQMGRP